MGSTALPWLSLEVRAQLMRCKFRTLPKCYHRATIRVTWPLPQKFRTLPKCYHRATIRFRWSLLQKSLPEKMPASSEISLIMSPQLVKYLAECMISTNLAVKRFDLSKLTKLNITLQDKQLREDWMAELPNLAGPKALPFHRQSVPAQALIPPVLSINNQLITKVYYRKVKKIKRSRLSCEQTKDITPIFGNPVIEYTPIVDDLNCPISSLKRKATPLIDSNLRRSKRGSVVNAGFNPVSPLVAKTKQKGSKKVRSTPSLSQKWQMPPITIEFPNIAAIDRLST
jgi:hypothetical protein